MTRANRRSRLAVGVAGSLLLVAAAVSAPAVARAHTLSPTAVVSRIGDDDMKRTFDVVSVATDPKLERLLIVRVGPRWHEVDPQLRLSVAEKWLHLWRDAVANGIVAVLDEGGDDSLVGYDADGNATLRGHFSK